MRALYNLLFNLAFLGAAPFLLFRLWRRGQWREGFGERFGRFGARVKQALTNRRVIWIHGASVGEVNLAMTLARALEERMPSIKFVISTTTTTGMAELRRKLSHTIEKVYYPIDRRPWVRRSVGVLHPEAVILMEAELWPNFLWHARRRHIPVMLVNARISDRTFPRYRAAKFLFRDLFANLAGITAREERDIERLTALGCRRDRISVVGSLKFGLPAPVETRVVDVPRILKYAGMPEGALVVLAASTHDGEEAMLGEVFRRLRKKHPGLYLVIVPRHHERAGSVGSQLSRRRVKYVHRSEIRFALDPVPGSTECLVVDTTGELRFFYAHAAVVFVGRSLVPGGGQNPVEPADAGRPVLFGPHMENFRDIAPQLVGAGGARQVADEAELEQALDELLGDPARREAMGAKARGVVESNRGVVDRTVEVVLRTLAEHGVE